jgi:hypothetical protein
VGHRGRRKYSSLFSSATGADEHKTTIFVGLGEADENKSFTSVPTKIVAHFRRIYFRRLFSSVYAYFRGFWAHENLCVYCSEDMVDGVTWPTTLPQGWTVEWDAAPAGEEPEE